MSETSKSKSLRQWLNQNSMIVTIITVVVLVMSIAAIFMTTRPPALIAMPVYMYDVEANQLFSGSSDDIPPIAAPSGKIGVRAYVFSCTDCSVESERFLGYLEMYTPEAKTRLQRAATGVADLDLDDDYTWLEQGHLVRDPAQDVWVPESSDSGIEIVTQAYEKCGGESPALPCFPSQ